MEAQIIDQAPLGIFPIFGLYNAHIMLPNLTIDFENFLLMQPGNKDVLYTFHQNSFGLVHIFEADKQSLSKGINHGEDHPDLNQLDVRGGWQRLADSKKAETFSHFKSFVNKDSQCGQNKHDRELDLDDHVKVLLCEPVHHLAQPDQHCSWQVHLAQKQKPLTLFMPAFLSLLKYK